MNEAESQALVERFNAVTSKIADKIRILEEARDAGGLTAEQEAAHHAQMLAIADALDKIGASAADPVPEPDPVPEIRSRR